MSISSCLDLVVYGGLPNTGLRWLWRSCKRKDRFASVRETFGGDLLRYLLSLVQINHFHSPKRQQPSTYEQKSRV